jgi:hypothetical protein
VVEALELEEVRTSIQQHRLVIPEVVTGITCHVCVCACSLVILYFTFFFSSPLLCFPTLFLFLLSPSLSVFILLFVSPFLFSLPLFHSRSLFSFPFPFLFLFPLHLTSLCPFFFLYSFIWLIYLFAWSKFSFDLSHSLSLSFFDFFSFFKHCETSPLFVKFFGRYEGHNEWSAGSEEGCLPEVDQFFSL